MHTRANETHGLRRSPTRANFQKMPRNLSSLRECWFSCLCLESCEKKVGDEILINLPCSFAQNSRCCRTNNLNVFGSVFDDGKIDATLNILRTFAFDISASADCQ